ncbi:MAG: DUF4386 family protein [Gammaproteobacteria bacterium]
MSTNTLQKAGGIAALLEALCYVVGFAVIATVLNPGSTEGWSSAQRLEFVLEREVIFQTWNLFIYVVFGVALVVLVVALHERLKARSASLMNIATAFGLIWAGLVIASGMVTSVGLETVAALYDRDPAQADSVWLAVGAIQEGLGGGVEIVGGIWVLLIGVVSLRCRVSPRALGYLGVAVGMFGILTIVPSLGELGAAFGLGQIVWFAWMGTLMLKSTPD